MTDEKMYEKAVEFMKYTKGKAKIVDLQRYFFIGYHKAAKLMERLQKDERN